MIPGEQVYIKNEDWPFFKKEKKKSITSKKIYNQIFFAIRDFGNTRKTARNKTALVSSANVVAERQTEDRRRCG